MKLVYLNNLLFKAIKFIFNFIINRKDCFQHQVISLQSSSSSGLKWQDLKKWHPEEGSKPL